MWDASLLSNFARLFIATGAKYTKVDTLTTQRARVGLFGPPCPTLFYVAVSFNPSDSTDNYSTDMKYP